MTPDAIPDAAVEAACKVLYPGSAYVPAWPDLFDAKRESIIRNWVTKALLEALPHLTADGSGDVQKGVSKLAGDSIDDCAHCVEQLEQRNALIESLFDQLGRANERGLQDTLKLNERDARIADLERQIEYLKKVSG